jgi:hypothetical protein
MLWLIAAIGIVLAVFLSGFRKLAIGLTVAALIGGFSLYQYNERQQQRASTRILVSEVVIEHIALKPTFRSSYDVSGRIRNNSEHYRVDGITLTVTLRDCQGKDKSSCVVIGQATSNAPVTVPPQQARDFIASFYFGSDQMTPKGTLDWGYQLTAVHARRQK